MIRLDVATGLPGVRLWIATPTRRHWKRYARAGAVGRTVADIVEEETRERVLEELRPGIYAEWTDLREGIGR